MITSSNKKQLIPAEENRPPAVIQEKPTPLMENEKELEIEKERKLENKRFEALEKALNEERHRTEDYLNRLQCLQADFENHRKRVRREIEEATTYGNESIIKEFLNVVDDLELSIQVGKQCTAPTNLIEGLTMVLSKTLRVLEKEGVAQVNALGRPFDPHLHEVVSKTVGEEDQKDDIVVEEIQKGYTYKGKIIRPSIVRVAIAQSPSNNTK